MTDGPGDFTLDVDAISAELQIGRDVYIRIVTKAIPQTEQDLADLEASLSAGDYIRIAAIAHRLKGTFDNMRITAIAMLARRMNDSAKTSSGSDDIALLLNQCKGYFEKLKALVGRLAGGIS